MRRGDRLVALDTEDDSEGNVYMVNFYDGVRHHTVVRDEAKEARAEDFLVRAWSALARLAPCTVWACNLEYDLINLFGANLGRLCTLQYVTGGILRATWTLGPVTFLDTLRHWPASVKEMGQAVGLPKLDADFRSVEYCRRDTEICWKFVRAMLDRYEAMGLTIKATLPSMAMQLFATQFFPDGEFARLPDPLVAWFRGGYHGGRVEVYRFGRIEGPVEHYDVNSLFPSVMVSGTFPDLREYRVTTDPDWTREGMADVTLDLPAAEYPALPKRGALDVCFPYGRMRATWTYPELRRAMLDGAAVGEVHRAVEFPARGDGTPFRAYVLHCYAKRREAPKRSLDDTIWKLMMNSLYGKFGQRAGLEMIYQDRSFTLETRPGPAANVVWAAYVTALARLRLLDFLRACSACYYTDTDSLHTPDALPTSDALGDLKHEGTLPWFRAVGNKMYEGEAPDATGKLVPFSKAKGVPRAVAADFVRTGRAVFRRPARFRESRRTGATANRWYEVEKRREAVYTKRRVNADGTTEPWAWPEYAAIHGEGGAYGDEFSLEG